MAIEYYGKTFDKYARNNWGRPYIGYFTPDGKLVDYNTELGGTHSTLANIVSWTFLLWIKQSSVMYDFGIGDVKTWAVLYNNGKIDWANAPIEEYNITSNLRPLQKDLFDFLNRAKNDSIFINNIKSKIDPAKIPQYVKERNEIVTLSAEKAESIFEIESFFGRDNTRELLNYLKEICIEYLGYDSIERFKPNGEMVEYPKYYYYYSDDYDEYLFQPRVITTSNHNIYERFFNYLLMDWEVHHLPKYKYNEVGKRYVLESSELNFYQSNKESSYKDEIELIKKYVKIKDRHKHFI